MTDDKPWWNALTKRARSIAIASQAIVPAINPSGRAHVPLARSRWGHAMKIAQFLRRRSGVTTSPLAQIAAEIVDELRAFMDAYEAQTWLLSGQRVFAGKSAIMMIREGRANEVRTAVSNMLAEAKQYHSIQKR
jgi:hypothetical protein